MAYFKAGKHHYPVAVNYRAALSLLAFKRAINHKNYTGGFNHHAPGAPAIGVGILFAAGL